MFKPDIYVKDVFEIDYNKLKANNIKLLCFDLDNTLDEPDRITTAIRPDVLKLVEEIRKDFDVMIISNNTIKGRVNSFADQIDMYYIEAARKPFLKKYINDEKISSYKENEIAFIGDKIVTDVIGAKRHKSLAILTDPLYPKNKHWYSLIMKVAEKTFCILINFKKGKYYDKM